MSQKGAYKSSEKEGGGGLLTLGHITGGLEMGGKAGAG